jgi:YHS domain-containing protein
VRGEHSHGPGEHSHEAEEHTHEPGAHGGLIVPIGSDSYHAEAVIEKNGDFRLFMLGKDESKIMEVDIQPINAYVKAIGGADATPMEMKAVPQDGDGPDKTSQFVGQLPEPLRGQPLEVTIPNLKIAGERFRIGFTTVTETHDEQMPDGISKDEEKQLLLTPGGHYTEADIQANGGVTATVKFKGIPPAHDSKPKPGDRLCPITMTKANPKFTWVVGGKPYQFCCPPCIEEFVKNAKESPDPLQDPESYVKPQDDSK